MKEPDYVAIKKPGEDFHTWYDRSTFPEKRLSPLSDEEKKTCTEMTYTASGKLIIREDGEVAEIWTPIAPC